MTHEVHSFTHTCIFMNLGGTLAENFSFTVLIIIALSGKPQTSYLNSKFFYMGHILSSNGTVLVVKKPKCLMIEAVDWNTGCGNIFSFCSFLKWLLNREIVVVLK